MPGIGYFSVLRLSQVMLVTSGLLLSLSSAAGDGERKESRAAQILKARGIDPDVLKSLSKQNTFPAGENTLDISVNGDPKGTFSVTISDQGHACLTPVLIEQLGLKQPPTLPSDARCADLSQLPGFSLQQDTEKLMLSIVVAQSALSDEVRGGEPGGAGAMLNYNYFSSISRMSGRQNRHSYLMLEDGVNVANWMLRGRQQLDESEGRVNVDRGTLYAQRTLASWKKRIQFGQIGVTNTLFSIGDITGLQLVPDEGLEQPDSAARGRIEGIAGTAQARVDVRQYGTLVYSTLVPAGPFHLDAIPLNNLNGDLEVTVFETDGRQQHFVVPAGNMISVNPRGGRGISIAAGVLGQSGGEGSGVPALLTLNQNWQVQRLSLQGGMLLAKRYQSVAASLGGPLLQGAQLAAQIVAANDTNHHLRSMQLSMSASYNIMHAFTLGASLSKRTAGFASLSAASSRRSNLLRSDALQYTLSASWSSPILGYFSYSHSESSGYRGGSSSRFDMLSWNIRVKKALLAVSISSNAGRHRNQQLSVNLSLPIGEQNISSYYRHSSNAGGQMGAQVDGSLWNNSSYYLAADREIQDRTHSLQGGISANLHYTRMSLAASMNSEHAANYSLGGSGGMALVGSHLLFSPQLVGDTFGMISLNEKLSGIEVRTPNGTVWTDWRGRALAADIPAWQPALFDLDSESLPRQSDVGKSHHRVTLARGSVKRIRYNILTNRRALLTLHLPDGRLLPRGGLVRDEQHNALTTVLDDGTVYLENPPLKGKLVIAINGEQRSCQVEYQLDSKQEEGTPWQKISGVCIPFTAAEAP